MAHLVSIVVPLTASLRSKVKTSEYVRKAIAGACRSSRLKPGEKYMVTMELIGRWENSDGSIRVRDGHNIQSTLIDIVCAELGIDDSQVWDWRGPRKVPIRRGRELAVIHFDRY